MTVTQIKQSYQCRHDAKPGTCIVEGCSHWSGLKPDDVESIFGRRSSSVLAAKLYRESPQKYTELRKIAMERNLIPREVVPVSLRPTED